MAAPPAAGGPVGDEVQRVEVVKAAYVVPDRLRSPAFVGEARRVEVGRGEAT
jgi:hypothetical protein